VTHPYDLQGKQAGLNDQAAMTYEFPFLQEVYTPVGQHKIEYGTPSDDRNALKSIEI
jgi:hypothetical protein